MTQRKFDILWDKHIEFTYPQSKESKNNKSENEKVIGENDRAFIDDIDYF